jgi:putative transcriptional regulator
MAIRNRLREYRTQAGLTQERLAGLLGVSRQTINAVENEKYNPSLALALKLGRVFRRPVEEIFLFSEGEIGDEWR